MNRIESITREILLQDYRTQPIIQAIEKSGGIPYLVGGAVRDIVLYIEYNNVLHVEDLDIEVHGLQYDELQSILSQFGVVNYVGKSFGVLKLEHSNVDFSLPRTDSSGRKPVVEIDPFMTIQKALVRRDVTMNAMAINLLTFELVDPFNGLQDLKNKLLRSPNINFFAEDPLRFYRVMQFIGRFNMYPDESLQALCKEMDISNVSQERIEGEFEKLLLKSERPSLGLRWLETVRRLQEILPELYATIATAQEPQWHPEGHVFEHSMQALDAAARFEYGSHEKRLIGLYAALCHDLGKPVSSFVENGRIRSPGHDDAGVPIAKKMLARITGKKDVIRAVGILVKKHMQPPLFIKNGTKDGAYKRLAQFMAPVVNLDQLIKLSLADRQGRNPQSHIPLTTYDPEVVAFELKAKELGILYHAEKPILTGNDIIEFIKPGPLMGEFLEYAYTLQIESGIKDTSELINRTLKHLKSKIE